MDLIVFILKILLTLIKSKLIIKQFSNFQSFIHFFSKNDRKQFTTIITGSFAKEPVARGTNDFFFSKNVSLFGSAVKSAEVEKKIFMSEKFY